MRILIAIALALAVQTAECTAETWELVKPDGLGFSVELPEKPEFNEEQGDDGGKIRTYAVKSTTAAYDVTIYDLPEGGIESDDIDRVLDNIRDRTIGGVRGELKAETKIDIGGHKARDLTADVMGMVWRSKIVIANNKIYQIVAIISKAAEHAETTEKYLSSFKLLGEAAGGAK